ncbi:MULTISPECIES: AsmA family protein [unclassified Polaromonas]|uniref:AsmA family protein n=1 Tax=unclassified Polaromonas TaxID=2638319 RepID=UPI000F09542C|nr:MULTISPECIES: AsmA family protein [unclassified Polaromonas]AYQ27720.1 AsmA family protein [Polaromonas sp. SP1]QGJ17428.1 AsmA family protein [Polaromonas sp. Pch-P]
MAKVFKWVVFLALGLMVLLAVVIFALHRWVSTEGFVERVEREATAALGVPVALDHVAVDVWPLPAVALSGISVQSKPAITVERVEVRPQWQPLLQGRLVVSTLLVRRAVLPQQGIDGVLLLLQKKKPAAAAAPAPAPSAAQPQSAQTARMDWLPRRTVLDEVTWISAAGARTTVQADARFGDDGLPDSVALKLLKGNLQGLEASLKREEAKAGAAGDEWALRVDVGGGKVEGTLGLKKVPSGSAARPGEELQLNGKLQTRDVEVSALTAPSKSLTGLLEAGTTLSSRAATTGALVDALQSQTTFTVRNAVLQGIDLAKAVKTVGLSRGGQTPLDTLAGQVHTQGKAAQLTNLVASSGALSATGNVAISPAKALSGQVSVNLAGDSKIGSAIGGAVGVPLMVGGTLDNPEVTLSRSALLGAAIGTVLMPGVGTGAGANLGNRIGDGIKGLFGK